MQQHFLKDTSQYKALLESLNLKDRCVVEVGIGHGELTKLILDAGAKSVTGFEVDASLWSEVWGDDRVTVRLQDFRDFNNYKWFQDCALICNPPYDLLPQIFELISNARISDVILMIPDESIVENMGYAIEFVLTGDAFEPPSKGKHYVVRKGF